MTFSKNIVRSAKLALQKPKYPYFVWLQGIKVTSKIAGTGMINSTRMVFFGKRNISSSIIAFTAPLAP